MVAPPVPIPIVGEPVAWAIGLAVLLMVVFTGTWVASLVTVAHEGGHVVVAILSGRGPYGFHVNQNTGGGATWVDGSWGIGNILGLLAGYLTPPLVGLAGASALRAGLTWPVLMVAVFVLIGAYFEAEDLFTSMIVLLAGGGIGWAAIGGNALVQAVVAVAVVWLMLFGAIRSLWHQGWGGGDSDAGQLARVTWIPSVVWVAFFWFVALLCLWAGARRLLGI